MRRVDTHAAANTKSMSIMGKLLTDDDYRNLLGFSDINEFMKYLYRNTHYSGIEAFLNSHNEDKPYLIKQYVLNYIGKLMNYYRDDYKKFFTSLMKRYEIENLKLMLRVLLRGEDISFAVKRIVVPYRGKTLNYEDLLKSENAESLILKLKGTPYFDILLKYLDEDPSRILFYMETELDRLYFNQLYESIRKLKKKDRAIAEEIYGTNVDLLNLQWIFRGRTYFGISSEELFNFTLNNGARYDYKKLKRFCYMALEDFKSEITNSRYKNILLVEAYLMENAMGRYLSDVLIQVVKREKMSIASPIYLFFRVEYELRDLFTMIEGLKYHFDDIEKFLIRKIAG